MRIDMFLAGVGGQGILSFSKSLGELALIRRMNVLIGETHGMAQRGGSVTAVVRYGDVHGSMIGTGKADLLVGFEPLEAARYAHKLSPRGLAIVNTSTIVPYSISALKIRYPPVPALLRMIEGYGSGLIAFDALEIARKVKFPLATNATMLGAVAAAERIDASPDDFKMAIRRSVPRRLKENLAAFDLGFDLAKRILAGEPVGAPPE